MADNVEELLTLLQTIDDSTRSSLESRARSADLQSSARDQRRQASKAVRLAKGYETGV